MNHTQNYYLPQWDETDRVLMTDFNAAMAGIEAGLTGSKAAADAAQATANNAYCPENKPYVVGNYTGTGVDMTFDLGFRPSFLIVSGSEITYPSYKDRLGIYDLITGGDVLPTVVTFTDTGFVLHPVADNEYPKLVQPQIYNYIAFR